MVDLTQLSDDQLAQAYAQAQAASAPAAGAPASAAPPTAGIDPRTLPADLSGLSDEDLGKQYSALTADQARALAKGARAPAQMTGAARELALPLSNAAKGGLQFLATPGDAWSAYTKYVGTPLADFAARQVQKVAPGLLASQTDTNQTIGAESPWTSDALFATGRRLGAVDRPDLVPQNLREEYEAAGAQGAGAALPYLATGGAAGIPRALLTGAASGAGAKLGNNVAPAYPAVGGLIGALAGMYGGSTAHDLVARGVNMARGETSPLLDAYYRMQIEPAGIGDATGRTGLQQLQSYASTAFGGAGRMHASADRAVGQFGDAVDRTASEMGTATTPQQAGTALQGAARDWLDTVAPAQHAQAWAPVDAAMGFPAAVYPDNYRQAVSDLSSKLAGLPETKKVLLSARSQSLLDAIDKDVPAGSAMHWDEAQKLRSVIGEIRGVPEISGAIGDKELGRMYGALSEDMRATAARKGVGDAFDAANATSTNLYAFQKNILGRIISSRNPLQETITPEQAAQNALGGGDTLLQGIRRELPAGADELGAYALRRSALATPGRQDETLAAPSPATFHTNVAKLQRTAPEGFGSLYAPIAPQLDDLTTVAHSMKDSAKFANTSHTGLHNELAGIPTRGFIGYEAGDRAFGPVGGAAGAGMAVAGGPLMNNLIARGVTSPWASKLLSTPIAEAEPRLRLIQSLAGSLAVTERPPTQQPGQANR